MTKLIYQCLECKKYYSTNRKNEYNQIYDFLVKIYLKYNYEVSHCYCSKECYEKYLRRENYNESDIEILLKEFDEVKK